MGDANSALPIDRKHLRKPPYMIPMGMRDENQGKVLDRNMQLLQVVEKQRPFCAGIEEESGPILQLNVARKAPIRLQSRPGRFIIVYDGDLHKKMSTRSHELQGLLCGGFIN